MALDKNKRTHKRTHMEIVVTYVYCAYATLYSGIKTKTIQRSYVDMYVGKSVRLCVCMYVGTR